MKSSLPLLTGLIILSQSILSVSAAVPTSPPSSSAAPAGGYFSQYFSNMIQSAPCSVGNVLTGFTTTAGVNYGVRQCTSIKSLLASIYGSSPAPANTVFDGFYSNGDIRYSPSTWLKSGTNLSYTGGNVGIGTINPTAKLEVNGNIKVGNSGVTCNSFSEGQTRYNSTTKDMEFCNGTTWKSMSGGGAGGLIKYGGSYVIGGGVNNAGLIGPCYVKNQITNSCTCPLGYTAKLNGYGGYYWWSAWDNYNWGYICESL